MATFEPWVWVVVVGICAVAVLATLAVAAAAIRDQIGAHDLMVRVRALEDQFHDRVTGSEGESTASVEILPDEPPAAAA